MSLSIVRMLIPSTRAASTLLKASASGTRSGPGFLVSILIPLIRSGYNIAFHYYGAAKDAVGTTITDRPPHRSVRALLRIRLPPWMSGEEASCRIRMQNVWGWKPPSVDWYEPIPRRRSLTAAA